MPQLLASRASRLVLATTAGLFLILGCTLAFTPRLGAQASGIIAVTTTADYALTGNGNADCTATNCSLRAALELNDCQGGGNTVSLPAGTYKIGSPKHPFVIAHSATVTGASGTSARTVLLDGNSISQVLTVDPRYNNPCQAGGGTQSTLSYVPTNTDVTLQHLTIQNGSNVCPNGDCGGPSGIRAIDLGLGGVSTRLTLDHVAVTNNTGLDGAIRLDNSDTTLRDVTISGNHGFNAGIVASGQNLSIINTTISGNGDSTSRAGAILALGTVHVAWSTIANNTASTSGAGGIVIQGGSVTLAADVLAGNGANCAGGTANSGGSSVADDATCGLTGTADQQSTNPQLSPLANNGGELDTQALLSTSPALDKVAPPCDQNSAGGFASSAPLTTDARDSTRPAGPGCDAGAFELLADTTPPSTTFSATPGTVPPGWPLLSATASGSITSGTTVIPFALTCFDSRGLVATLTATDDVAVDHIDYTLAPASTKVGGQTGSGTFTGSTGSVAITTPGLTLLTYHATDKAGNAEVPKTELIVVSRGALACASTPVDPAAIPPHGTLTATGSLTRSGLTIPFAITIPY